jgi:hypothetical protein
VEGLVHWNGGKVGEHSESEILDMAIPFLTFFWIDVVELDKTAMLSLSKHYAVVRLGRPH